MAGTHAVGNPSPFVILEWDEDAGWTIEDEYADRTTALVWFRHMVDDQGKNAALIDIEEVQNP